MDPNSSILIKFNGMVLDPEAEALRDSLGKVLPLRSQSFAVLKYLALNAEKVVSKHQLMDAVWPGIAVTDNSLVQCIHEIRQVLGDENQSTLKTVSRRGYRLTINENLAVSKPGIPPVGDAGKSQLWLKGGLAIAATLAIVLAAIFGWREFHVIDGASTASIAVLPFTYVSDDKQLSHLADGFTEDIITDLTRFRDLEVIASNSSSVYKEEPRDIKKIAHELNVDYLLEGVLRRQNNLFRVTAQLVETSTGAQVWAERWDRPIEDVFAIQTELSQELAGKMGGFAGNVLAADKDAAMRKRPSSLSAYDIYLMGIEAKNREDRASVEKAISLFKQSLEIDPRFARAWTMLGSAYGISKYWSDNVKETQRLYVDAVTRAVEIDPLDAEAHAGLGFALAVSADPIRGKAEFDEALRLNPNSADVLVRYSFWAAAFGEPEKGAEMARHAMRLNPNASPSALRFMRYAFLAADRNEEALAVHNRLDKEKYIDGDYIEGAILLTLSNRISEAKALVHEAQKKIPDLTIESWTGTPEWGEVERAKVVSQMRKAGFTPCSPKDVQIAVRLPECL